MKFRDIGYSLQMHKLNSIDNVTKPNFCYCFNLFELVFENKLKHLDCDQKRGDGIMHKTSKPGIVDSMTDLHAGRILNCPCTHKDIKIVLDTGKKEIRIARGRALRKINRLF